VNAPWIIISAAFETTGGQDRANFALTSFLAQRGHETHLVAHRAAAELRALPNVHLHPARRPLRSDLLGEPFLQHVGTRVARSLAAQHPNVVGNGGNCDWPGINWVHYVHAAHARDVDGSALRRARIRMAHRRFVAGERRALHRASLVIANSDRTHRDVVERVGVPHERVRVIYYGIDPAVFLPATSSERTEIRGELGLQTARPLALFIGALGDRRKGFDTLFHAWRILHARHRGDATLLVIGRGADLLTWEDRTQHAGLAGSIRFLGFRDDVPRIMRACDVLVAPTRYDSYGLGVQEALCCGIPAIVTADAGVAERYPAELHELLLPDPDNAPDLADRVSCVLDHPARFAGPCALFSSRLRQRTWDDMAREIVALAPTAATLRSHAPPTIARAIA
jgi:glycosyltransferase involved in cell wall biosynthesis